MRSTRTIVFGCALIAVALVFWGVLRAINQSNTSSTAPNAIAQTGATGNAVPVAVAPSGDIAYAATDIPAGAIVTPEMLQMKAYSGPSTTGFITDVDSQASGFITRVAIPAGAQIRPSEDFVGHISQVGIAGALQPGMRALVLPLPGKPTLHDLVKIGNSVDILASFDGQEARTIAQNVRVLAVDVFASDFPQVNAAMRGPYKADKPGRGLSNSPAAPGASGSGANAAPDSVEPQASPTPVPANAPAPDPALTLEVTPQQAAAIQLALASNAPIDFLVRPALPGNRTAEVSLVSDNTDGTTGETGANSVTKRQIAPYAEAIKNRDRTPKSDASNSNSGRTRVASNSGGGGGGARFPSIPFPPMTETVSKPPADAPVTPFVPLLPPTTPVSGEFGGNNGNNSGERLAPAPPSTYKIPIYSDGGIVRTETVPVPIR